jgi:heme exporter protein B
MDGLLISPVDREAIYLGKAIANFLFVGGIQVLAIPAVALFYNLPFERSLLVLFGIALLAALGLVAVGTLFSAMAVNTRMAELLLPMLSLPFFVPVVMAAAESTARLLAGRPIAEAWPWLRILLAFDLVFIVACTLAFPFTLEE